MTHLHIALQDGFSNDHLIIRVNGSVVFDGSVTTRYQIGLADTVETEVDSAGATVVELLLPDRRLSKTVSIVMDRARYLAVSIVGLEIRCELSTTPFRYL